MIQFFGYKKCSTSRKAEVFLEKKGIRFQFIDITENPPSEKILKQVSRSSGIPPEKMFNTSGQVYKEGNYKAIIKDKSKEELFSLLASNGRLIKRPVVTDGKNASVGYNEESLSLF